MCRGPRGRASLCVLTGLRSRLFRAKEQFAQALAPAPACHRVPIEEQLRHIFFRPRLAPRGIAKLAHLDHRARRALTGPPCRYQDPFFLLAHLSCEVSLLYRDSPLYISRRAAAVLRRWRRCSRRGRTRTPEMCVGGCCGCERGEWCL